MNDPQPQSGPTQRHWDSNQMWPRRNTSRAPTWMMSLRAGITLLVILLLFAILIPALIALAWSVFTFVQTRLDHGLNTHHGPVFDLAVLCALLIGILGILRLLIKGDH